MKVYAVKIWLTLVHSIRSYDCSKKVEVFFFETTCIICCLKVYKRYVTWLKQNGLKKCQQTTDITADLYQTFLPGILSTRMGFTVWDLLFIT